MKKTPSNSQSIEKILFLFSVWASVFFGFLFLNHKVFHWDNTLIGFVQELFTLPMILATFTVLVVSGIRTFKLKVSERKYTMYSMFITLGISTFIIGSFL